MTAISASHSLPVGSTEGMQYPLPSTDVHIAQLLHSKGTSYCEHCVSVYATVKPAVGRPVRVSGFTTNSYVCLETSHPSANMRGYKQANSARKEERSTIRLSKRYLAPAGRRSLQVVVSG